jgi:hypothetical protein
VEEDLIQVANTPTDTRDSSSTPRLERERMLSSYNSSINSRKCIKMDRAYLPVYA